MRNELKPGPYWMHGIPRDHKRVATAVDVLGRVPGELYYYRVKLPDGRVGIASDSMLSPRAETKGGE